MIDPSQFKHLVFRDFFKHLEASVTTATVVTPSRRLSLALKESFNLYQNNDQQKVVWHSADILPLASFLERVYLDAFYSGHLQDVPLLLTPAQTHVVWENIIRSSEAGKTLLNVTQTARLADEAWVLLHAWQLKNAYKVFPQNENSRVFRVWAEHYQALLEENHQTDAACLADVVANLFAQETINKPEYLLCYGFQYLTPQQTAFLHASQQAGCEVILVEPPLISQGKSSNAAIKRYCCIDSHEEMHQAAVWARSRLEADNGVSIGVVVPELADCRSKVLRIFTEVMQPDVQKVLSQSLHTQNMPFNVSLGVPLFEYPLVDTAFSILALTGQSLAYEHVSCLLRSPFLGAGDTEMNARALLEIKLRQYAEPLMTLEQLVSLIRFVASARAGDKKDHESKCPILARNLSSLLSFCQHDLSRMTNHADFAKFFSQALQIVGFPGERTLDSTEYQTLKKWHEVVADFATLDRVIPSVSIQDAIERLKYMAANTLFQPQTPRVPIQILGVLEAAGMTFDHLWVMGLSDEQWPLRQRPNPFLPCELQQKARIPLGSTTEALKYSRQLKDNWFSCAKEVVLSHPKFGDGTDAQEISPSQMIAMIPEFAIDLPNYKNHRNLIIDTALLERIADDHVQPMDNTGISGGVAVIKDYAACPFRAWARHRMQIKSNNAPHAGLNAMERGVLMHHALFLLWKQLKTKQALDTLSANDFETMLASTVDGAISNLKRQRPYLLSDRFMAIEHRRLMRLIREWIGVERKRENFSVIAMEEKHAITLGGLRLQGRLDRVDKLDNGQLLIIDYKTRQYNIDSMLGKRPDEPQLPLYLIMAEPPIVDAAGVTFVSVKTGQMGFSAIVNKANLLPEVKIFNETKACAHFATWDDVIADWRQNLMALANGFLGGNACVMPKNYPVTCQHCEIKPFCRIHERLEYNTKQQEIASG